METKEIRDFLGCKTLNNIKGVSKLNQCLISKYSFQILDGKK